MTIKVLFQKENSEGVDANQQTAIRKEGDASFLAAMEIVSEEKK
jgi:hypothetical protein